MAAGSTDSSHACQGSTCCSPAVAVMPRTIIGGHNSLCGTRGCKFIVHGVRTPGGGARLTPGEDCSQAEKGQILRGPTPGVRSGFAQNKVAPIARRGQ